MNIFISGIGGVGMGSLALIARDAGHAVRGSDIARSLTTKELENAGISIIYEQTEESLRLAQENEPIDWYIHTAALPSTHPELSAARSLGIRTGKRDTFLTEFLKEKNLKLLAVAGTHGKTTTTSMLVWSLMELGIPVSYSIGSQLSWGASGRYEPGSEYFVYECDEFDRNFLQFHPYLSLITSVEYDHPDTYPTEDDYKSAFRQFIQQSDAAILWQKDARWLDSRYPNAWAMQDDEVIALRLNGEHNRRNGTLVAKALERLHIGENMENRWAIESFPGVGRRFEKLADNLYSDYGHTPTEIAATLQLAREISNDITLIYQPHQNVRQHEIQDQYTDDIFQNANKVYWLPTYLSREDKSLAILAPEDLTKRLNTIDIQNSKLNDELWQTIEQALTRNSLVICMGAGSIDSWVRQQLDGRD